MPKRNNLSVVFASVAVFAAAAGEAQAGIACKDGFQKVQGNYLATPYCQDAQLADVARQYGMKAPARAIRDNPNFKREVCRLVGQDIRVQSTCGEVNPNGRVRPY